MANANALFSCLNANGFRTAGAACYGMWSGYLLTVTQASARDCQVRFAVRVNKNDNSLRTGLLQTLRQRLGKTVTSVVNQGSAVQVGLHLTRKEDVAQQFFTFANTVCQTLAEMGVAPADSCLLCGGGTPESLCFSGSFQPVHAACVRQGVESLRSKTEAEQANGSYLTGLLGAALGALIGTIPTIAILLASDYIFALLFALVPLAAMFGYRKLKGKNDKVGIVIVIAVSLLAVFVMVYVLLLVYVMKNFGCGLSTAMSLLGSSLSLSDFAEASGMFWKGFVFMILGIVISWGYLMKTGAAQVQNAELTLNTLVPNPRHVTIPYPQSGSDTQPQYRP